jgi:maleylpyruvate isomerase
MDEGTSLFLSRIAALADPALTAATRLEGWTRRHLVAHVAGNAEALNRLVHWALTGEPTAMYATPEQRGDDIATGAQLPPNALRSWLRSSASDLSRHLDRLSDDAWAHPVVTAQGRTVAATEIPWLRAREVMVHAVDLDAGVTFGDLPRAFVAALIADVVAKRSGVRDGPALVVTATDLDDQWIVAGNGDRLEISGRLADLAAWLTGRAQPGLRTSGGAGLPTLPPWL